MFSLNILVHTAAKNRMKAKHLNNDRSPLITLIWAHIEYEEKKYKNMVKNVTIRINEA